MNILVLVHVILQIFPCYFHPLPVPPVVTRVVGKIYINVTRRVFTVLENYPRSSLKHQQTLAHAQ